MEFQKKSENSLCWASDRRFYFLVKKINQIKVCHKNNSLSHCVMLDSSSNNLKRRALSTIAMRVNWTTQVSTVESRFIVNLGLKNDLTLNQITLKQIFHVKGLEKKIANQIFNLWNNLINFYKKYILLNF